jgi:hypothetical protein
MAFAIPRIQYKNLDTTGTTASGNGTITSIADTSLIEVGMFVRGTGIPDGALVDSKTSSTVVLASGVLCTASATVAISFGYEILFDYPPIEEGGEELDAKNTTSESLSGVQQTALHYIEGKRKLKFSFLSPAIYTLVDTFLKTWGLLGEDFRYYEDKTLTPYTTYELDALKVNPKKIAPRGVDTYVWEVPLSFRRVIT